MLPVLNEISTTQVKPTKHIKEECQHIDYATTYSNACAQYYASDVMLLIDSNVSSLALPNTRSRITGYF